MVSRSKILGILVLLASAWASMLGCEDPGGSLDGDVTAVKDALLRLSCTIRHSSLGEYSAMLGSTYSDGFLDREAKIEQMRHLFDTGFFSEYVFTNPDIWFDGDRAVVQVDEAFTFGHIRRQQQDLQEWRKENGVWRLSLQYQPDPSLPIQGNR